MLLLGRYYSARPDEPAAYLSVSKARHWDMGEQDLDLFLDLASLNLVEENQSPRKIEMDEDNWSSGEEDEGSGLEELRATSS